MKGIAFGSRNGGVVMNLIHGALPDEAIKRSLEDNYKNEVPRNTNREIGSRKGTEREIRKLEV